MYIPSVQRYFSAQAIIDQFEMAKDEIKDDISAAHAWYPIIQSIGPALIEEAYNALEYGENMVCSWMRKYMLAGKERSGARARRAARHFNQARVHKSHARRIDRDEAQKYDVTIDKLETSQDLQDAVLSTYHVCTIIFEKGPTTKLITSHRGRSWVKGWQA